MRLVTRHIIISTDSTYGPKYVLRQGYFSLLRPTLNQGQSPDPQMTTPIVHARDIVVRPRWLVKWERLRHHQLHWLVELFAEALGVFFYTYAGAGATAPYVIGNILGENIASGLEVGFAYAFGILLAIVVCSATSGGHFNPCVSIAFVVYKDFPPLKAMRYIVAQIFGGYIACLLIYAQYRDLIMAAEAVLESKGVYNSLMFTPTGPGGILGLYLPVGSNISRVLLNEFVVDTFLALVIWACIDQTNFLVPPAAGPWVISFAYAIAIWAYAPIGIAANAARDVGGRLAAMTIWGLSASGGRYAALAALVNIPATLFGATLYEMFLMDTSRVVPTPHLDFFKGHMHHLKERGTPVNEIYDRNPAPISPLVTIRVSNLIILKTSRPSYNDETMNRSGRA